MEGYGALWVAGSRLTLIYLVLTVMFFDVLCCAATFCFQTLRVDELYLLESVEFSMVSAVLPGQSHALAGS
jgi:hypothetical protein